MIDLIKIKDCYIKQNYQSWCGLACICMVTKYYGGNINQEKLVKLSGTKLTGTTLLGLFQASEQIGLKSTGLEGNTDELVKLNSPAILHIVTEEGLQHYIVFWGTKENKYIISDPTDGIKKMNKDELDKLWKSKTLLLLERGENFKEIKEVNKAKIDWLKSLLIPDKKILIIIFILSVIFSILGISLALFSQKLVDNILPSKDIQRLIIGTIVLAILLLLKNGFGYYKTILTATQIKDFTNRIVTQFYNIILYLPKVFFDSLKTGEVTARLNDAAKIQNTINYISSTFIIDILTIIVITIILFIYWWPIALISIILSLIFALIFLKNAKTIMQQQLEVMSNYAQSESNFFNSIQGIDIIKSYVKEHLFSNTAKLLFANFQNSIYNLRIFTNKISLWTQNIAVLLVVLVISVCSYGVFNNHITLGELVAILTFSSTLLASVGSLMSAYFTYQEAKVAYHRLYEFIEIEPEELSKTSTIIPPDFNTLAIENLSFRYIGRALILNNISLKAELGSVTIIKGEIGCGKSSLLNLILRFYTPEKGDIKINNESIYSFNLKDWRESIGVMPQEIKLFNSTLIENICLDTNKDTLKDAKNICTRYGLDKFWESLPMYYLTKIGEDGINLSGGQKQLLGLSRALVKNPKVLLLDEPTNNMDKASIELFWNIIEKVRCSMVVIIVTHDDNEYIKIGNTSTCIL